METTVETQSQSDRFAWVNNPNLAKLILRVNLGFLLILHGLDFAEGDTKDFQLAALSGIGMPGVIAFPVGLFLEVVCPFLVILGIYSRLAALGMAIFMASAIGLVNVTNGAIFQLAANKVGWFAPYRLEIQFFFLWNAIAVFLFGGGKYGLNIGGRWNN